jgi:hypothetical protein
LCQSCERTTAAVQRTLPPLHLMLLPLLLLLLLL